MLLGFSWFEGVLVVGFAAFFVVLLVRGFVQGFRGTRPKRRGYSSGFTDGGSPWFTGYGGHDYGSHGSQPFDGGGQDAGSSAGGYDGGASGDCGGGSDGGGCGGGD